MEINYTIQTKDFDINKYNSNRGLANVFKFTKEDGTIVEQNSFPGGYAEIETPPKPKFYKIRKMYYQNGKIREIGPLLSHMSIGIWRYYDENGKETIVDEDEKYGMPNYNDVLVYLDKKGYIDLRTGERREKTSIGYEPEKKVWSAYVYHFNGENHVFEFNQKGKLIDHKIYNPTE